MSASRDPSCNASDDNRLVRPKLEFHSLLQHAGATKDVLTMKEVMFYLGQYIMKKQLYDQTQQHIVHCSQDPLGRVLGVDSFSVKEPRVLFAMLSKNLVAVQSPVCPTSEQPSSSSQQQQHSDGQAKKTEEGESQSSSTSLDSISRPWKRSSRSRRNSEPGPSHQPDSEREEEEEEERDEEESEEEGGRRKRRRSDSYSLTFDGSLSWCVIGGLGSGRERHNSQSSGSTTEVSATDSDSDHFSVEFEVESIASEDYDEDDASLSADDQVYEVTIIEAEDDDSFDEDTEISEADYWRCPECDELNAPLPRNCLRCWTLRQDWLPEELKKSDSSSPKPLPLKPSDQSAALGSDGEENDGVDVPDGKRPETPLPSQCQADSAPLCDADSTPSVSQELLTASQPSASSESQPCSSSLESQELLPPEAPPPPLVPPVPNLERSESAEWRLPESCLDPCLICQSRPKNGCIVHGRTGHMISCYLCARKLKKRNKLCPVCRMPIQTVVLTYLS